MEKNNKGARIRGRSGGNGTRGKRRKRKTPEVNRNTAKNKSKGDGKEKEGETRRTGRARILASLFLVYARSVKHRGWMGGGRNTRF